LIRVGSVLAMKYLAVSLLIFSMLPISAIPPNARFNSRKTFNGLDRTITCCLRKSISASMLFSRALQVHGGCGSGDSAGTCFRSGGNREAFTGVFQQGHYSNHLNKDDQDSPIRLKVLWSATNVRETITRVVDNVFCVTARNSIPTVPRFVRPF
jgi:hypothetical protein